MDKKLSREQLEQKFTPNILIVDDEPRMCTSLKSLLSDQNYNVFTAKSGQEALDFLPRERLDIVILDIVMPELDGYKVMDQIKRQSPETMVILMTGYASVGSALEALKGGAYDYLRKPFENGELLKTVGNALSQKRLKHENEVVNGKLALFENRHRYLAKNSPDILYTLDEQGNFTFVSDAVERLLGFECEELHGKHYSTIIAEEDLEKAKWVFNERRTGDRAGSGKELRLRIYGNGDRLKNYEGRHRTVELKSTGIYDKPGIEKEKKFLGTYGIARDISDRKQLEIQLQQARRMEAIGMLAGGVAHDFNNLLTGIQARASLMLMDVDPSHAHFEHLSGIGEYIKSAADLTKQILGFARGGKYEIRTTDLNEFIKKQNRMFGRTKKEVTVRGKYQEDLWTVEVDRVQLEQVLLNLYVNASDAMPRGGDLYVQTENVIIQKDCAEVFHVEPGKYVKISVTDTGAGMEEAVKERIFDPFFTTKEMGRGAGLGLASAYGIIKNHSGIINVYSEEGHGTTFNIYLPASEKEISEEKAPEKDLINGSESVLIIDDEDMVIDVGEQLLEKMGYKVFTATSGVEAIEVYSKNSDKIDMVILDMIMPGMSGSEVYENLRKIKPDIKVLLSSGYSINGNAQEILDRGCNCFIQKPFTLNDLSRKLREVLDGK